MRIAGLLSKLANAAVALLLLATLTHCSLIDQQYVYVESGRRLYRMVFEVDQDGHKIIGPKETWIRERGKWRKIEDQTLGDRILSNATSVTPTISPPNYALAQPGASKQTQGRVDATANWRPLLYVLDILAAERVVAIDLETNEILGELPLPLRSSLSLAADPSGDTIYTVHRRNAGPAGPPQPGALLEIATNPLSVVRKIDLPDGLTPSEGDKPIALSPGGQWIYVATSNPDGGASPLLVIDRDSGSVSARIEFPDSPAGQFIGVEASPDGTVLYALGGTSVYAIDTLTGTVSGQVRAGVLSRAMAIHPNGTTLYVALNFPKGVAAVDTATLTVAAQIEIEQALTIKQLEITGDGLDLFANDQSGEAFYHIDTATNTLKDVLTGIHATNSRLAAPR